MNKSAWCSPFQIKANLSIDASETDREFSTDFQAIFGFAMTRINTRSWAVLRYPSLASKALPYSQP